MASSSTCRRAPKSASWAARAAARAALWPRCSGSPSRCLAAQSPSTASTSCAWACKTCAAACRSCHSHPSSSWAPSATTWTRWAWRTMTGCGMRCASCGLPTPCGQAAGWTCTLRPAAATSASARRSCCAWRAPCFARRASWCWMRRRRTSTLQPTRCCRSPCARRLRTPPCSPLRTASRPSAAATWCSYWTTGASPRWGRPTS
mmetsp:Transcript_4183/g.15443  ORF Transcript_4183/g.15443 Transcript_4183/m.15443 type:complete len:204 (-) Transcript_4183:113-724(-)